MTEEEFEEARDTNLALLCEDLDQSGADLGESVSEWMFQPIIGCTCSSCGAVFQREERQDENGYFDITVCNCRNPND